jgi:hypothetical protein
MAAMAAVVKSIVFTLVVLVTESKKYGPHDPRRERLAASALRLRVPG